MHRVRPLIISKLGPASPLLRFAEGIVTHLSRPPAAPADMEAVAAEVTRILRAIDERSTESAVDRLVHDPAMLASFFQNADLLDHDRPETVAVSAVIAEALQRVWPDAE